MITLTKDQARKYLVQYHMINTQDTLTKEQGIKTVFERIKSIQVDPLDIVGKNVDLVLQARIKDYQKSDIDKQLYQDYTIIQGWDKQMCIYQTKEYPFFSHVRKERADLELHHIKKYLNVDIEHLIDHVYQLIKEEGPKFSKDIQLGETIKGYWGTNHKESKLALGYLFHKGDIQIKDRTHNHKRYDITSRILGDISSSQTDLSDEDFTKQYLLRRIESLGLMSNKSGVHTSGTYISNKTTRSKYLKQLLDENLIEEVMIEGIDEIYYKPVNKDITLSPIKDQISFIAPLDNLIWDRDMIHKIFDFYYRWEVYTPMSKREYGYYVLPILYQSEFIGRIEFKKQKTNQPLEVLNVWFEPNIRQTKKLDEKLKQAIKRFEKYNK